MRIFQLFGAGRASVQTRRYINRRKAAVCILLERPTVQVLPAAVICVYYQKAKNILQ